MKRKENKTSDNSNSKLDEKEDNFVRKAKRRTSKYKDNIPFKWFNFGEVGHFYNKCPYAKNENINEK